MTLELAVSVWSLQRLSLTQGTPLDPLLGIIAGMDVGLVEINEDYLLVPPYNSAHGYRQLRKRMESLNLGMASIWFYADLIGTSLLTEPAVVSEQIADYLAIAAQIGCPRIVVPSSEAPADLPYERAYGILRDVFDRVLPVAEEYGVDIGLEVGRTTGRFQTPDATLKLITDIGAENLQIVPDFEAWRRDTPDLPISHVESNEATAPASLSTFAACLPHAPLVHAKLLRLNENGDDPHFPLPELMAAIVKSGSDHILDIEFEGWIPDIDPERDCIVETRRCVALLQRLMKQR